MSWVVPMEFSRVWVIGTAVESGVVVFGGSSKIWSWLVGLAGKCGEARWCRGALCGPITDGAQPQLQLDAKPSQAHPVCGPIFATDLHFAIYLHFVCMSWQFEMFVLDCDRYPYVTGTSVLGIKYKDGILLASDTAGVALLTACLQPAN